ncbi:MAG: FkbM family methyltransferase [Acidimicrobiales bacterium]
MLQGAPAPSIEHDFLRRLDVETVIDVGANIGQFATWVRWRFPDAALISFEPFPHAAATYRQHVSGPRVTLHECALGSLAGTSTLHVAGSDDSSSLLEIGDRQVELYPSTKEVDTIEVPVRRLDEIVTTNDLRGAALLKIDVQGTELDVLHGASALVGSIRWVYVECSFVELYTGQALAPEIVRFLDAADFDLEGIYNVSYHDGRAIQGDFLFVSRLA